MGVVSVLSGKAVFSGPAAPRRMPADPAAVLQAADARVRAAARRQDDHRYADAIAALHDVVLRNPALSEGTFLLHSHRAQYLIFQAGRTTDIQERRLLYAESERELRAAVALATPRMFRSRMQPPEH